MYLLSMIFKIAPPPTNRTSLKRYDYINNTHTDTMRHSQTLTRIYTYTHLHKNIKYEHVVSTRPMKTNIITLKMAKHLGISSFQKKKFWLSKNKYGESF